MAVPIKQINVGGTNYNIRGYFYGTCTSAVDVGEKVVNCPEFTADDLTDGTLISISFSYELDYEEAGIISLNVNNTGDKALLAVINGQINSYIYFYNVSTILCTYSSTLDS